MNGLLKTAGSIVVTMALLSGCPLDGETRAEDQDDGETGEGASADGEDREAGDAKPADDDEMSDDASVPAPREDDGDELDEAAADPGAGGADGGVMSADAGEASGPDSGSGADDPTWAEPGLTDADRALAIAAVLETENYEQSWFPFFEDTTAQRPLILAPSHGNEVRVFQNATARQATDAWLENGMPLPLEMPSGSIVAKKSYKLDAMSGEMLYSGTLVMAKVDALDPLTYEGNWFFVRITTTGEKLYAATCVNCHNGRAAAAAWPPKNPDDPADKGGRVNGLVRHDYMFGAFCADPLTSQCESPSSQHTHITD